MKRKVSTLSLRRETIRNLEDMANGRPDLVRARGMAAQALSIPVCTQALSDCQTCTTPLDGCPPQTGSARVCCS